MDPWVWLRDVDGWRRPIRPGATIEIFDGLRFCYECDAAVILDLLAVNMRLGHLIDALQQAGPNPYERERLTLTPARKPPAPSLAPRNATAEARAELRARRKARKR